MKIYTIITVLLLMFLSIQDGFSLENSVIITISENTIVKDSTVKLYEISEITTLNTEIRQQIQNITIYQFSSDSEKQFHQNEIVDILRENTNNQFEIYLQIPDNIMIRREIEKKEIDLNSIKEMISIALEDQFHIFLQNIDHDLKIRNIEFSEALYNFTADKIEFNQRVSPKASGFDRLDITIYDTLNEKHDTTIIVNYDLKVKQIIAKRAFNRGDIIDINSLSFSFVPYQERTSGDYISAEDIAGMAVNRSIRPGSVISSNMLKEPVIIKRGDIVDIIINTGSIQLRTKGRARNNGSMGEFISLQPISYNKIVRGQIQDNNTVIVEVF